MYPLVTPTSKINAGTPTIPTMPIIAIGSFKGFSPLFSAGDKNASVSASFFRVSFGSSPLLFSALTTVKTFLCCRLLEKEVVRGRVVGDVWLVLSLLFAMVFDDDLVLYDFDEDEKAIVVAVFGENEIEALIILSYLLFFCSQTLLFLYTEYVVYMWRVVVWFDEWVLLKNTTHETLWIRISTHSDD